MDKLKLFFLNNKKIIIYSIVILILIIIIIIYNEISSNEQINIEPEIIQNNNENGLIKIIDNIENQQENQEEKIEPIIEKYIYIDIKGEIKKPNVYKVNEKDSKRVIDIINLAGGLTKNAYTNNINMSLKVYDEMVIIISSKEETKIKEEIKKIEDKINDAKITENNNSENNIEKKLININIDSLEKLQEIPGIGESKAEEIIQYRKDNNGFKTIDEIKNISGIGEKTFEKLKDYITV